jgi:pimeloyl-ACP methyl ester carboxylesterase
MRRTGSTRNGAAAHARRWGRAAAAVLTVVIATGLLTSACGGGATRSLQSRLLSVANLPAGWSATAANATSVTASAPCLSGLGHGTGFSYVVAAFVQGSSIPNFGEVLASGPQIGHRWQALGRALDRCRTATVRIGSLKASATVRRLSFPRVASTSAAYGWSLRVAGLRITADMVLFQAGPYAGYISYSDLGSPPVSTVRAIADAAAAKARTGTTTRVAAGFSIASAPVRIAHTSMGAVGYRVVGTGPPVVLITGYSGTMESWDRLFVDALAQHYLVVIFDNAGIGRTAAVRPLSIDAMASQTSALIRALGLGRPDVLGWSMGSMIAQALAVLHPAQVRRLVLCASYPGNGSAVRPGQAAIVALQSGKSSQVMADLFPPGQAAAANTYVAALSSYPAAAAAPAAVVTAQGRAVDAWWAGTDPAGERAAEIAVPTLVTDGSADRLDPLANSRTLARLIPGARLVLYPDAGHAFLFQDQASVVPLIESFLG